MLRQFYLIDIVTATSGMESRSGLRSASSDRYEIPRSRFRFGERFAVAGGPRAWNNLPTRLHQTRSTVTFKVRSLWTSVHELVFISLLLTIFISLFTVGHAFMEADSLWLCLIDWWSVCPFITCVHRVDVINRIVKHLYNFHHFSFLLQNIVV